MDVNVTGMPAEVIGSYAFNVPGGGFAVPPDTPGYTLQLTGAADPAGAAYLKALSNDPVGLLQLLQPRTARRGMRCGSPSCCCSCCCCSAGCGGPACPPPLTGRAACAGCMPPACWCQLG